MDTLREEWLELRPSRKCYVMQYTIQSPTTLFFIHGAGGRSEQWREQIKFFKNKYNLVALDLLGLGKSDKPIPSRHNPIYTFLEFSADIQILFNRCRTEKNIIVGHSYGGAMATYLAAHNASMIQKLILSAPLPFLPKFRLNKFFDIPPFILEWFKSYLTQWFIHLAYDPKSPKELLDQEIIAADKNRMYVIQSLAKGIRDLPSLNLNQIKQPTLVLLSNSDRLVPAKESFEYYRQIPHVEFQYIPNAGHMLILEQPTMVNQCIEKFIGT